MKTLNIIVGKFIETIHKTYYSVLHELNNIKFSRHITSKETNQHRIKIYDGYCTIILKGIRDDKHLRPWGNLLPLVNHIVLEALVYKTSLEKLLILK